ncbi:UDP-glucuronic acid dehydrogenase [Vibrio brasiliensis]|uniref:formyltransferase family protein n=1 Tax=Vibrio brasiliensis TaxID=170652 RepID=UPI001EFE4C1A|nr:formyltransferase family protein [Vibrio brasiliensis]MCG9752993.1 UDP-glucuronic acid dehydrogenase [Vibrio brasiliensis]
MKITILCSDKLHPVYPHLEKWASDNKKKHDIQLLQSVKSIAEEGDILFLVSCSELVNDEVRSKFHHSLVLHASDLPNGRGWSPHIWEILQGSNTLTLSLLNAEDKVDSGDIWAQEKIHLSGTELYDEINDKLFAAEINLMDWACKNIMTASPKAQSSHGGTYYRKRVPEDSKLDEQASIASQFDLLRVCDPKRFPAYVVIKDKKYKVILEKCDDE